eukprot:1183975-Prorocentrum_minimum.AAC.4
MPGLLRERSLPSESGFTESDRIKAVSSCFTSQNNGSTSCTLVPGGAAQTVGILLKYTCLVFRGGTGGRFCDLAQKRSQFGTILYGLYWDVECFLLDVTDVEVLSSTWIFLDELPDT